MKDAKTGDDLVSIGFVVDLEYADATTSAHDLLQLFKLHHWSRTSRGWRACRAGRQGACRVVALVDAQAVVARSACSWRFRGMVDNGRPQGRAPLPRLRKAGRRAIYASLKEGKPLSDYEDAVEQSTIGKELWQVRNTRQPFQSGFIRVARSSGLMSRPRRFPAAAAPGTRTTRSDVHRRHQQALIQPDGSNTIRQRRSRPTVPVVGYA